MDYTMEEYEEASLAMESLLAALEADVAALEDLADEDAVRSANPNPNPNADLVS